MNVALAYLTVVLIWSTTPLAIKWSVEGPGFLFGVSARMVIGAVCVLLLLALTRRPLPWHRKAVQSYLAVFVQIYGSMLAVYWGAQYIPSGWMSVIFGLTPMMTALLAAIWLGERSLRPSRLLAYALGLTGLGVLFGSALELGPHAFLGIAGVLLSAALQAVASVLVKRINAELPAMTTLAGGLLLSVVAYVPTWLLFDGVWPDELPVIAVASIGYLGLVATTLGFSMYYYALKHLSPTQVALIPLLTPVTALILGHVANNEPVSQRLLIGTAFILTAVLIHEFRPPRIRQTNRG
jgi:drug/metabolite transporter (DMT)-like permease